jgi:membrane protein
LIRTVLRLAWKAFRRFHEHHGPDRAAAVAYYTLLSLLPLFIFVISLGAMYAGSFDAAFENSKVLFHGILVQLRPETVEALRTFVERAVKMQWPAVLLFAWTSRRIFASLFSALGAVFGSRGHGFAKGNLLAFGMVATVGLCQLGTMLLAASLAAAHGLLERLAGPGGAHMLGNLTSAFLTHVVPVLVTLCFFFLLYRLAPGKVVHTRDAVLGAVLASVLWEVAKAAFAWYVRHLTQYAGLYGALEGVIVLALWLELSVAIILYCGEVVAIRAASVLSRSAAHPVKADTALERNQPPS